MDLRPSIPVSGPSSHPSTSGQPLSYFPKKIQVKVGLFIITPILHLLVQFRLQEGVPLDGNVEPPLEVLQAGHGAPLGPLEVVVLLLELPHVLVQLLLDALDLGQLRLQLGDLVVIFPGALFQLVSQVVVFQLQSKIK